MSSNQSTDYPPVTVAPFAAAVQQQPQASTTGGQRGYSRTLTMKRGRAGLVEPMGRRSLQRNPSPAAAVASVDQHQTAAASGHHVTAWSLR